MGKRPSQANSASSSSQAKKAKQLTIKAPSQVTQEMLDKVTEDVKRHIPKDWSLEVIEISDDEGEEEEEEEEEEARAPAKKSQPNKQGWDEARVVDKLRPYVASLREIRTQDYYLTDTVIPDTVVPSNLIATLQEAKKILLTGKEVDKLTWFHLGRAYWCWCEKTKRNPWAKSYLDFRDHLKEIKEDELHKVPLAKVKNGIMFVILNMWLNENRPRLVLALPSSGKMADLGNILSGVQDSGPEDILAGAQKNLKEDFDDVYKIFTEGKSQEPSQVIQETQEE